VTRSAQVGDTVVIEIGSGNYEFAYQAPALSARVRRTATQ
jgi:hypothetical protein